MDKTSPTPGTGDFQQTGPGNVSSESRCCICLDRYEDVSYLNRCFHKFCFHCIQTWSETKAECPLCKLPFDSIFHSVRADDDFEEYVVRPSYNGFVATPDGQLFLYDPTVSSDQSDSAYSPSSTVNRTTLSFRTLLLEGLDISPRPGTGEMPEFTRQIPTTAIERSLPQIQDHNITTFRQTLYGTGARLRNTEDGGDYRDSSAELFCRNPACLRRLAPWLQCKLRVLFGAHGSLVNRVHQLIMRNVTRYDLESHAFVSDLRPFLQTQTEHFMHELISFAQSVFNTSAFDRHYSYDCPVPSYERGGHPDSSVTPPPNTAETEELDMRAATVSQAPWDDDTPGPSSRGRRQRESRARARESSWSRSSQTLSLNSENTSRSRSPSRAHGTRRSRSRIRGLHHLRNDYRSRHECQYTNTGRKEDRDASELPYRQSTVSRADYSRQSSSPEFTIQSFPERRNAREGRNHREQHCHCSARPRSSSDISAAFFRVDPSRFHRLMPWLKRKLTVFCGAYGSLVNEVLEVIRRHITIYDLESQAFVSTLRPFLLHWTEDFIDKFISHAQSVFNRAGLDQGGCSDYPAPFYEEGGYPGSSVITCPEEAETEELDMRVATVSQAPWDDETPGPSSRGRSQRESARARESSWSRSSQTLSLNSENTSRSRSPSRAHGTRRSRSRTRGRHHLRNGYRSRHECKYTNTGRKEDRDDSELRYRQSTLSRCDHSRQSSSPEFTIQSFPERRNARERSNHSEQHCRWYARPRSSSDISADFFRVDPSRFHRLLPWLKHELRVLFGVHGCLVNEVLDVIMSHITIYDLESQAFVSELRPFLLDWTEPFIHEFINYAQSVFNMADLGHGECYDCPAPFYEEGGSPDSSVITSPDEAETQELDMRVATVSQALWDDETPGPSSRGSEQVHAAMSSLVNTSDSSHKELTTGRAMSQIQGVQTSGDLHNDSDSSLDDCVTVGFVKPLSDRTPEHIEFSDSEDLGTYDRIETVNTPEEEQSYSCGNRDVSRYSSPHPVLGKDDKINTDCDTRGKSKEKEAPSTSLSSPRDLSSSLRGDRAYSPQNHRHRRWGGSSSSDLHSQSRSGNDQQDRREHHEIKRTQRKRSRSRDSGRTTGKRQKKTSRTGDSSWSRRCQTLSLTRESTTRSRSLNSTHGRRSRNRTRDHHYLQNDLRNGSRYKCQFTNNSRTNSMDGSESPYRQSTLSRADDSRQSSSPKFMIQSFPKRNAREESNHSEQHRHYCARHRSSVDISADFFRMDPSRFHRLVPWLKHKLRVLFGAHGSLVNEVLEVTMSHITVYDLESEAFVSELRPFLLDWTEPFIYEFLSYAQTAFNEAGFEWGGCHDCPASSYEEVGQPAYSVIMSPDEAETQELVMNVATVSHAPWDDETPGPSSRGSEQEHCAMSSSFNASNILDRELGTGGVTSQIQVVETNEDLNNDSNSSSDDCVIVGFVKPLSARTPELIVLSSDSEEFDCHDIIETVKTPEQHQSYRSGDRDDE